MPFYLRLRSRPPIWQPALLGAGLMLIWTTARAVFVGSATGARQPGVLARILYIVAFTIVGGLLAGASYWVLDLPPLKRSVQLRWLGGTIAAAAALTAFSLAASQFGRTAPIAQLTRPAFAMSTLLVSVIFGWLLAKGFFTRGDTSQRVYLSPAAFAALSPADQARLRPDPTNQPEPTDPTGAS
jgi:hypothetical protein